MIIIYILHLSIFIFILKFLIIFRNGKIILFDTEKYEKIKEWKCECGEIYSMAVSFDGNIIACGCESTIVFYKSNGKRVFYLI